MDKLLKFLQNRLAPFGEKVAEQRHLKAMRDGFMMAMPLVLIGSFFVLINSFPIHAWQVWLKHAGDLSAILGTLARNSFGLMALLIAFGVAYRLAEFYKTDPTPAGALSVAAFLLVTPSMKSAKGVVGIPYGELGGKGLFSAIIVGLISAEIYRWFIQRDIVIKMPKSVPEIVGRSFSALLPGITILVFFVIVRQLVFLTGQSSLTGVLAIIIAAPLSLVASTLPGTFIAVFLNSFFWFCGVNGGQVVNNVITPLWLQNAAENIKATQLHHALPNIVTQPFIDLFVYMGGGGATIGLALCLMFLSKSREYKVLGRVSGIPALFNINTAILFTFPTVLNPVMLIPFILTPLVNATVTYLSMAVHLVPYTTGILLPWTTPPIIGGFLATGSWQGAVLQVVLIILSFVIYYPFFKTADARNLAREQAEKETEAEK